MHDASIRRVRRFPPWQDGALRQRLHLRGGLSRRMSDVKVVKVSLPRSSDPALSMCFLEGGTSNIRDFLISVILVFLFWMADFQLTTS